MIDTDKYTGHTEGPWWAGEWFTDGVAQFERGYGVEQRIVNESPFVDHSGKWVCLVDNEADSKLIADAPLILADYKRLRGILGDIIAIDEWGGDGKDVGITITYSEGDSFMGWLNKCDDEVIE